jgi:hypothetical protein
MGMLINVALEKSMIAFTPMFQATVIAGCLFTCPGYMPVAAICISKGILPFMQCNFILKISKYEAIIFSFNFGGSG